MISLASDCIESVIFDAASIFAMYIWCAANSGLELSILFAEFIYPRIKQNKYVKEGFFILAAILFTAISEASTGYLFEWITGHHLWDYGDTFPCRLDYVCVLPTSLFGVLSYLVVKFFHPLLKRWVDQTKDYIVYPLLVLFTVDVIYTLIRIFSM